MLWYTFKRFLFFPYTSRSMRRFFFAIHCENLIKLLEVKLTKVWGPPCDYVFLELSLRIVHLEPLASLQLQFSSSYPGSGAHGCPCSRIPVPLSSDSLEPLACLSNLGIAFALWLHFSYRSKKSCWFFSLLSSLLFRMEWQPPNSLLWAGPWGRGLAYFLCFMVAPSRASPTEAITKCV